MRRRAGLTVAVAVLASIVSLAATVSPALAIDPPVKPYDVLRSGDASGDELARFWNYLRETNPSAFTEVNGRMTMLAGDEAAAIAEKRTAAAIASRLLVACEIGCRFTLLGTAALTGYVVYRHFAAGDFPDDHYDMWLDSDGLGKDSVLNLDTLPEVNHGADTYPVWQRAEWRYKTGGDCLGVASSCFELWMHVYWHGPFNNIFEYGDGDSRQRQFTDWNECDALGILPACFGFSDHWYQVPLNSDQYIGAAYTFTYDHLVERDAEGPAGQPQKIEIGSGDHQYRIIATGAQLLEIGHATGVNPDPDAEPNPDNDTDYTVPEDQGTDTDLGNALDPFDTVCGRAWINYMMQPDVYSYPDGCIADPPDEEPGPTLITLPKPALEETYDHYVDRLQDLGWLGDATGIELDGDTGDPEQGPHTVITIQDGDHTYRRRASPGTAPRVDVNAPLTFRYNPPDFEPVPEESDPGEGGGGGGGSPDFGDCSHTAVGSVDVTPITELDYGSRFPFGIFSWAITLLGSLNVTPDAPHWAINVPSVGADYNIDLEPFSPYMATMRTVLAWVMWVGSVWYFATSLLGFRSTGNPADAMDDYLGDVI